MTFNHMRTFMLLAAMTALFMGVGYLLGGAMGMMLALVFAGGMNVVSYWNADKIVLRMYGAKEVTADHPDPRVRQYADDIRTMAQKAGLPLPRITIMDNPQPNAFATGRDPQHAAVAATTGLLSMMTRREIRAVMAHELAHVRHRDTLTMTVTATIAGAISALANFAMFFGGGDRERPGGIIGVLAISIFAPMAAALVQMAISRGREYEADKGGAEICGDPEALALALQKIENYARGGGVNMQAERNPATAHMFIMNPLAGRGADNLFSTHPSTQNRISALMKLAVQAGPGADHEAPASSSSQGGWTSVPPTRRSSRKKPGSGPWGQG